MLLGKRCRWLAACGLGDSSAPAGGRSPFPTRARRRRPRATAPRRVRRQKLQPSLAVRPRARPSPRASPQGHEATKMISCLGAVLLVRSQPPSTTRARDDRVCRGATRVGFSRVARSGSSRPRGSKAPHSRLPRCLCGSGPLAAQQLGNPDDRGKRSSPAAGHEEFLEFRISHSLLDGSTAGSRWPWWEVTCGQARQWRLAGRLVQH